MNAGFQITMISKYFYPEPCATGQLLIELASELQRGGFRVDVLTGQAPLTKGGSLPRSGDYEGIAIRRVWCTKLDNGRTTGKAINRLTFSVFVLLRLFMRRVRVLLVTSDPPFLCWIAMVLKKIRGVRFIYILHDIHPDASVKLGYLRETSFLRKIWDQINRSAFRESDSVVVLGKYMKQNFDKRFGECSHKVRIIPSWADGDSIRPMAKEANWFARKHGLDDKFVVLHAGSLGGYHDLETVIMVADRLRHLEDMRFVFIGEGNKRERILGLVDDLELENVIFMPFQPREYLPFSLTSGDVSVVSIEKGLEGLAVPCKLYTSLAAGLAIWGLAGQRSEIADVIQNHRCGFRTDQGDVEVAVKMLSRLFNDPKLLSELKGNSRKCFEGRFDKKTVIGEYVRLLKELQ